MKKHLEFTLSSNCAIKCEFCPQSKLTAAYTGSERFFPFAQFVEILSHLPDDVEIHFSGFSEPFLNPNAASFIFVAKGLKRRVCVYTTLIGLGENSAKLLKLAVPDLIRIHVPDKKAFVMDTEKWIVFHDRFMATRLSASYMSMGEIQPELEDYLAAHRITVEKPTMLSRAGNLWEIPKRTGHIRCSMDRWHCNVVMPNGDVYGDCMDYGLTVKLGNLLTQSYQDIFDAAEKWRESFKDENSICAQCEWSAGV